jgi:hypothetical protein
MCRVLPIQRLADPLETPAFLLLRSPSLGCHATMWYCYRAQRIHGSARGRGSVDSLGATLQTTPRCHWNVLIFITLPGLLSG